MEFKDIASVSGKPGLFQILKPTRTGVILETLDAAKVKTVVNSNTKVSILKDITVYTTGDENIALIDIFSKMNEIFKGKLPINAKSSDKELKDFLLKVVPNFDSERVYVSDIKKMVNWYTILHAVDATIFDAKAETSETETEESKTKVGKEKSDAKSAAKKVAAKPKNTAKPMAKTAAPAKKNTVARKAQ
jgi:predicted ribonuclease toxin of YeeF-YezG toxin-antitoxin module